MHRHTMNNDINHAQAYYEQWYKPCIGIPIIHCAPSFEILNTYFFFLFECWSNNVGQFWASLDYFCDQICMPLPENHPPALVMISESLLNYKIHEYNSICEWLLNYKIHRLYTAAYLENKLNPDQDIRI